MFRFLKKYFIPHRHNDHQPHFLRTGSILVILVVVLAAEAFYLSQAVPRFSTGSFAALVLPNALIDQTNEQRESFNLNDLKLNPTLTQAAQLKANDMAAKGYFSHNTPDGKAPWYWLSLAGYDFKTAGENLAVNYTDSIDVTNAWMNSPTHRENILKPAFTEIGIATAQGQYKGQPATFVVQFFGTPNYVANPPVAANPAPQKNLATAISTEPKSATTVAAPEPENIPSEVKSASTPTEKPAEAKVTYASPVQRWLASPSHLITIFFAIVAILLAIALLLKIFIKFRIQHPVLITNGIVALIVISALFYTNIYFQSFANIL